MIKINLMFFIFSLFIIHQSNSLIMLENLVQSCPQVSTLMAQFQKIELKFKNKNKDTEFPAQKYTQFYDLKNIHNLALLLFANTCPIGEGSFGKIYSMQYLPEFSETSVEIAAKVIRFPVILGRQDLQSVQNKILLEIQVNKVLNEQENGLIFFPKLYGCFEMTSLVNDIGSSIDLKTLNPMGISNISHSEEEGMLTVFTEKLEFSMFNVMTLIKKKEFKINGHNRLNMFEQGVLALSIMDPIFTHCDIKPENIMFKQIEPSEVSNFYEKGISPVRFIDNAYYNLNFIDFGLVAIADEKSKRECQGGTPGFIPKEYFTNGKTHEKFDVYSLGMAFLDLELNTLGFEDFSQIDSLFFLTHQSGSRTFSELNLNKLSGLGLVLKMKKVMVSKNYKSTFLTLLAQDYPYLKMTIESGQTPQEYMKINPLEFLDQDIYTFRQMMLTAIKVYFNYHLSQKNVPELTQTLDQEIEQIEFKKNNSSGQEVQLNAKIEYVKNKKKYLIESSKLSIMLVNLYIMMISEKMEGRPSVAKLGGIVNKISKEFYNANMNLIEDIQIYEEEDVEDGAIDTHNLIKLIDPQERRGRQALQFKNPVYKDLNTSKKPNTQMNSNEKFLI